jgi:hypothetical protein
MYLKTVLQGLSTKKQLDAEDLYKLNEATFNLPVDENIDEKMTSKLFAAIEKSAAAYANGKYDKKDTNFSFDYVALLGTMQNQSFFSKKQNQMMINWLKDALSSSETTAESSKTSAAAKGETKAVARLEEENRKLAEEIAKLKELSAAVLVLKTIKLPEADSKGKGSKGKGGKGESGKGRASKDSKGGKGGSDGNRPPADPARKELKAQVNAAGRALAKKKREVIEKYNIEADAAMDHEDVTPLLEKLKELKEKYNSFKKEEA